WRFFWLLSFQVWSLLSNGTTKAECADFSDLCDDGATDDLEAVRVWSRVFRSRLPAHRNADCWCSIRGQNSVSRAFFCSYHSPLCY
ncbi:unnamed protein product, partial [Brassica oleracea var. botrytis]